MEIKKKLETMFAGGSVQDEVDKVLTIEKGMKLEDLGDQFKTQPRPKPKEVCCGPLCGPAHGWGRRPVRCRGSQPSLTLCDTPYSDPLCRPENRLSPGPSQHPMLGLCPPPDLAKLYRPPASSCRRMWVRSSR